MMKMAKICLPKGSGKRSKFSEKSGNFEKDIERQPCSETPIFRLHMDGAKHLIFNTYLDAMARYRYFPLYIIATLQRLS